MNPVCPFASLPVKPVKLINGPTGQRANGLTAFSLVEVVISIAILSVGLIGAIRVFPVGLRASQRAELLSRATLAAERTVESLKLRSWDELPLGESTSREEPFDLAVSIDQPTPEGVADSSRLKRISVTVSWTQEGRPRSLSVVTYVRRPNP